MSDPQLRVFHNHQLVGQHDARCVELRPDVPATITVDGVTVPVRGGPLYHRRHEGNDLVVVEDGKETRYPGGTWSAADIDLACGYMAAFGTAGCPVCETRASPKEEA